jgi:hypothetical protein
MFPQATVDIAKSLSDLGILDRENAAICGVSVGAIRKWRYGSRATAIATGTKMFLVARAATVGPSTSKPTPTCLASISATGT